MRPSPKKLPAVPTGFECFDLLWSQLIPDAADYLAILPRSADPKWATAQGLRFVAISLTLPLESVSHSRVTNWLAWPEPQTSLARTASG